MPFYVSNFLVVDAADQLALRNGTTAQTFRIYGTYTDASNYTRGYLGDWTSNEFRIGCQSAGTGFVPKINLLSPDSISFSPNGTLTWVMQGTTGHLLAYTDNTYDIGGSATTFRPRHIYVGTSVTLGAGAALNQGGAAGAATTANRLIIKKTGIADNTATDILTVTVPNANHAAAIKLTILSSNGSTDAFESSRCAEGMVILARTTGVDTVAAVATLTLAQIATVAAGATHTLAYGVSAMTGAAGATQTFTIQLTIDDSGNTGLNQVVILAELINAEASGVTMAAA